jgi:hypothetical protein
VLSILPVVPAPLAFVNQVANVSSKRLAELAIVRRLAKKPETAMPHRPKIFKRFRLGKDYEGLAERHWEALGELLKVSLPEKSRRDIGLANTIYSVVGPLHSSDQTVNLKTASAALDTWLKASGRFRLTLGEKTSAKKLEKAEIIARFWGRRRVIRLGKMQPLAFFQYVLDCATSAALIAQAEIFERKLNPAAKAKGPSRPSLRQSYIYRNIFRSTAVDARATSPSQRAFNWQNANWGSTTPLRFEQS